MTASYCDCLICRLEGSLIAKLSDERSNEEFRSFALSSPRLTAFPTAFELVRKLQDHHNHEHNPASDELLLELLGHGSDTLLQPMWQRLLLLVFIPTIHRTTSQIAGTFPSLTRDDTAQHLFAVLLEFLHSKELRSRNSHRPLPQTPTPAKRYKSAEINSETVTKKIVPSEWFIPKIQSSFGPLQGQDK